MLDDFRSTSITWDKATRRIYSPITANASDSNGRKLNIQVVNSGQIENLTGATLHLYWETKDKAHDGLDAFDASDISKGEFELFYTTGMLSNVGELNATLVLVDSTGKVVSDWFKITVTRGINEGAIESENSFSSLTQALIDISNLEQNYAPRLNELTAQLQQTEQEIQAQIILNKNETDNKLMTKTTKGEIGLNDLDKNKTQFDETWFADSVKQQWVGNTPVNATPPDGGVTTIKLADNAVTVDKSNYFVSTKNLFNPTKIAPSTAFKIDVEQVIPVGGIYTYELPVTAGQKIAISDGLGSNTYGNAFLNSSGTVLDTSPSQMSGQVLTAPDNAVKLIISGNMERIGIQQIELNDEITSYIPHRVIKSEYIDKPVTFKENFYAFLVSVDGVVNIDKINKKINFPNGAKYIFYGGTYVSLATDFTDFSYTNGYLFYDLNAKLLRVGDLNVLKPLKNILVLGYLSDTDIFLNMNHTINGKANLNPASVTKEMLDFNVIGEIPTLTVDSKWKGKKGVTFSDSIGWYDGQPFGGAHKESGTLAKGYQSYMREQLQCNVDNKGASGQDMIAIANIVKAYDFSDTDFATLTSGANDERKGVPVGTLQAIGATHNATTFTGALQSSIEYMIESNKNMKIYLMTPIRGWYNTYNTPDVPNTDPNVVGMMSETYANAIKEVATLYGIPVLDWYNLTQLNELNKNDYLGDITSLPYYLHPTNAFFEKMASCLIPFLNNY